MGISREDLMRVVRTARRVNETPAKAILQLAERLLDDDPAGSAAAE